MSISGINYQLSTSPFKEDSSKVLGKWKSIFTEDANKPSRTQPQLNVSTYTHSVCRLSGSGQNLRQTSHPWALNLLQLDVLYCDWFMTSYQMGQTPSHSRGESSHTYLPGQPSPLSSTGTKLSNVHKPWNELVGKKKSGNVAAQSLKSVV